MSFTCLILLLAILFMLSQVQKYSGDICSSDCDCNNKSNSKMEFTCPPGYICKSIKDPDGNKLNYICPPGYTCTSNKDSHGTKLDYICPPGYKCTSKNDLQGTQLEYICPPGYACTSKIDPHGVKIDYICPPGYKCTSKNDVHGTKVDYICPPKYKCTSKIDSYGNKLDYICPPGYKCISKHDSHGTQLDYICPPGYKCISKNDSHGNQLDYICPPGYKCLSNSDPYGTQLDYICPPGYKCTSKNDPFGTKIDYICPPGYICTSQHDVHGNQLDYICPPGYKCIKKTGEPNIFTGDVHGKRALIEDFAYQLSLKIKKHVETVKCSGVIITKLYGLTTAHCTDGYRSITATAGTVFNDLTDGNIVTFEIVNVYQHPKWNNQHFDIAILKFTMELVFKTTVHSINILQKTTDIPLGAECISSGWGHRLKNADSSNVLLYTNLKRVRNAQCENVYQFNDHTSHLNHLMCFVGNDGCTGDSGSPLVFKNRLVGILSGPIGCTSDMLPIYAVWLARYDIISWLRKKIDIEKH